MNLKITENVLKNNWTCFKFSKTAFWLDPSFGGSPGENTKQKTKIEMEEQKSQHKLNPVAKNRLVQKGEKSRRLDVGAKGECKKSNW